MRDPKTRTYRHYDLAFRQDALALLRRTSRSQTEVAADLGLPVSTLNAWYKSDMAKRGKKVTRASSAVPIRDGTESMEEKLARLEHENAALRRENDELKTDRAILKKAAAFFAKESE
jgi:transposase